MGLTSQRVFTNRQLAHSGMFIALMAIGANLTSFITVGTVPLTFQTIIAILSGILLGKKAGTFSMIGYVVIGFLGVPVFSGFQGGLQIILSPNFGFILSFIIMAFAIGFIMEKWSDNNQIKFFLVSYLGIVINYMIGIVYLYFYTLYILNSNDISLWVIGISMIPFFIKDLILASIVATLAPRILRALRIAE